MNEPVSGASRKQLAVYAIVERKDADKPSMWLEGRRRLRQS